MPEISFIIPSYNSYKTITRTVDSIFNQRTFHCVREIIIVDSSDDQHTRHLVKKYTAPKVKTIVLDKKTAPGTARNIGASGARSELLCFIDSDVILEDTWLNEILDSFHKGRLAGSGSVSLPFFQINKRIASAQLYLEFNEYLNTGTNRTIKVIPACNMFIQKKIFEQAGSFPGSRAAEDVLLSLMIWNLTPVWFIPKAKCFHIFRENIRSYFLNQMIIGKHNIIYRNKFYSNWFYKGPWPLLLLPAFLLIKVARINRRIHNAGWDHYRYYLSSFHLLLPGLLFWAFGFFKACLTIISNISFYVSTSKYWKSKSR